MAERPARIAINVILVLAALSGSSALANQLGPMSSLPSGSYIPFLSQKKDAEKDPARKITPVQVQAFKMDVYAVSNAAFLEFVKKQPQWRRSNVKSIFADGNYLKHWKEDLSVGGSASAPVTNVSWFAARAYCESLGKRLPMTDEWEYAIYDKGRNAEKVKQTLLKWHSEPNPSVFPSVKSFPKNGFGIAGLYGLVWEWTEDFGGALVTGEGRDSTTQDSNLFCGGGGMSSSDAADYPRFLRYGYRSSLKAEFTVQNLGFRCVKEIP